MFRVVSWIALLTHHLIHEITRNGHETSVESITFAILRNEELLTPPDEPHKCD